MPPYGSDNANGYDRYGNLVKIDSIQCSSPALNLSVNGYNQFTAYTYDASGNMLTDGSTNSYTWNGEGQLKSTGTVNYTYDGDGNRVEKSSGTYYWSDRAGRLLAETDTSGSTQNEYIYFGRKHAAWRDSGGNAYYYFQDQIGTSRLITNSSGTVCYDADYAPFGYEMAYTTNCPPRNKFAGMELDGETGNYHTLFRGYEPNLGRWMSPDPKRGCIKDPQKLNLYPYVRNGPTYRTDRRGDIDEGPCDPFTNPGCNNILTGLGWCEPWNLLCPWGSPQPGPIIFGCGIVYAPAFDFGQVAYEQITDASVGGGDCGYPVSTTTCTAWTAGFDMGKTVPGAGNPCPNNTPYFIRSFQCTGGAGTNGPFSGCCNIEMNKFYQSCRDHGGNPDSPHSATYSYAYCCSKTRPTNPTPGQPELPWYPPPWPGVTVTH